MELPPDTEDELDLEGGPTSQAANKPPRPVYTTKYAGAGRYTSGVEATINITNHNNNNNDNNDNDSDSSSHHPYQYAAAPPPPRRKSSYPAAAGQLSGGGGGFHRSRDRTRQSAVQRLVERKLAQKEKEREKERDRSLGGSSSNSRFDSFLSSRHSTHSYSPTRTREASTSRSENGFILGAGRCSSPAKENIEPDWDLTGPCPQRRRSARSVSATRLRGSSTEEASVKTFITIGPGKPTRIREHSPAKSAKLSSDESVSAARQRFAARSSSPFRNVDLNRQAGSPSPTRRKNSRTVSPTPSSSTKSKDILRNASPLKSTDILKTFRAFNSESTFNNINNNNNNTTTANNNINNNIFNRKKSSLPGDNRSAFFSSERVFRVNQSSSPSTPQGSAKPTSRRLSVDILNSINPTSTAGRSGFGKPLDKRASPDSDTSSSSSSSPLSSLSGSTDSVESDKSVLSQRRISLEQRFQARARFTSPDRSSTHTFSQSAGVEATTKVDDTWTHIKIKRYSTVRTQHEFTSVTGGVLGGAAGTSISNSGDNSSSGAAIVSEAASTAGGGRARPIPASRKISLPQTAGKRPEPAPRRRSLTTILSSERLGLSCLTLVWWVVGILHARLVTDLVVIVGLGTGQERRRLSRLHQPRPSCQRTVPARS